MDRRNGRRNDRRVVKSIAQPQIAAYYPQSVPPLFAVCNEWTAVALDARESLPVSSDVSTLVLAGYLSHIYFYEFPGNGHSGARSSRCAVQMALAFWDDPRLDPGSICQ